MKKLLLIAAAVGGFLAFRKKAAANQEADLWHEATSTGGTRPPAGGSAGVEGSSGTEGSSEPVK